MVHPVYAQMPQTIFDEMSLLAREKGAINLGQGFPDAPGPRPILQAAAEAVLDGWNQYPPSRGLPALREAAAFHYERTQGLALDWQSQIIVTSGATEAIACALMAFIRPGDRVGLIQPLYDAYLPLVRRAGGEAHLVSLAPPLWRLTERVLDALFAPGLSMVILNNPMNPMGRVFDDEELSLLARYCVAHDVIALCDEVWEAVVPPPCLFRPLMAYPGMARRTIKVASAGKMFGLTGWKVGLLIADQTLSQPLAAAHQFMTFTTPPNLQTAVAYGLTQMTDWFERMPAAMGASRDRLTAALRAEGFAVLPSEGTYFLTVDLVASGIAMGDHDFCRACVNHHGVAAIPLSALYAHDPDMHLIRLCFAKADETLNEGAARLAAARAALA